MSYLAVPSEPSGSLSPRQLVRASRAQAKAELVARHVERLSAINNPRITRRWSWDVHRAVDTHGRRTG